jgi:hypothetical protein
MCLRIKLLLCLQCRTQRVEHKIHVACKVIQLCELLIYFHCLLFYNVVPVSTMCGESPKRNEYTIYVPSIHLSTKFVVIINNIT